MKVALVLTGFMRNWEYNFPFIENQILSPYHPDIYITSYTYSKFYFDSIPEKVNIQKVLDTYKPKNYIFREEETCPEINFKDNNSESIGREYSYRQLYGWYTHKLALDLFNFDDYDVIVKLRTDIAVSGFLIDRKNDIIVPSWKYHPGPCNASEAYVDYIAYGPPESMRGYFSLFDKLEEMHHNKIDISLGETLLKKYIERYVTPDVYEDERIDWILRGEQWASEKGNYLPTIPNTSDQG